MSVDDSQASLNSEIAKLKADLVRAVLFEVNRAGRLDSDEELARVVSERLAEAVAQSIRQYLVGEDNPLVDLRRHLADHAAQWEGVRHNIEQDMSAATRRVRQLQLELDSVSAAAATEQVSAIESSLSRVAVRLADLEKAIDRRKRIEATTTLPGDPDAAASPSRLRLAVGRTFSWLGGMWKSRIAVVILILLGILAFSFRDTLVRMIWPVRDQPVSAGASPSPPPRPTAVPDFARLHESLSRFNQLATAIPTGGDGPVDAGQIPSDSVGALMALLAQLKAQTSEAARDVQEVSVVLLSQGTNREPARVRLLEQLTTANTAFSRGHAVLTRVSANPRVERGQRLLRLGELRESANRLGSALIAFQFPGPEEASDWNVGG